MFRDPFILQSLTFLIIWIFAASRSQTNRRVRGMIMSGKQFSLDSRYWERNMKNIDKKKYLRIDLAEAVEEAKGGCKEVVERIEEV